jgi:hypothetical protein
MAETNEIAAKRSRVTLARAVEIVAEYAPEDVDVYNVLVELFGADPEHFRIAVNAKRAANEAASALADLTGRKS